MSVVESRVFEAGNFIVSETYPFVDNHTGRIVVGQFQGTHIRKGSPTTYYGYLLEVEEGCHATTMRPIVIYQAGARQCLITLTLHLYDGQAWVM